jgi:adenylate kinase family enzyme
VASEVVAQLPSDARRVVVRGTSGAGKTTLARRVAVTFAVPHLELDGVFHQANWTPLDDASFAERVQTFAAQDGWVACGNYSQIAPILLARADTVVFLDLPRRTVMHRVVSRTLRRAIRREELWNGNKEPFSNFVHLDPQRSVIAWAWTTHRRRHEDTLEFLAHPPRDGLRLLHVTSKRDERVVYEGLDRIGARERAVHRTEER